MGFNLDFILKVAVFKKLVLNGGRVMTDSWKVAAAMSQQKSPVLAVVLVFFFGGFGMFYVSIKAGIICSIIEIILWFLCFVIIGLVLVPIFHISLIIYVIITISKYNQDVIAKAAAADRS